LGIEDVEIIFLSTLNSPLFYLLFVSIVYSQFFSRFYGVKNPMNEKFSSSDFTVSSDAVQQTFSVIHEICEEKRKCLNDIFNGRRLWDTLVAVAAFFVLSTAFGNTCPCTLMIIGFWVAYLFPFAYSKSLLLYPTNH